MLVKNSHKCKENPKINFKACYSEKLRHIIKKIIFWPFPNLLENLILKILKNSFFTKISPISENKKANRYIQNDSKHIFFLL